MRGGWVIAGALALFACERISVAPLDDAGPGSLDAGAALSGGEAYAVGGYGVGSPIVRFVAGAWAPIEYPANHNFFDVWAAGPDEVFACGVVGNTFEPVIVRGFR